jgi:hypothetical protein
VRDWTEWLNSIWQHGLNDKQENPLVCFEEGGTFEIKKMFCRIIQWSDDE